MPGVLEPHGRPTLHGTVLRTALYLPVGALLGALVVVWWGASYLGWDFFRSGFGPGNTVAAFVPRMLFYALVLAALALQRELRRRGLERLAVLPGLGTMVGGLLGSVWLEMVYDRSMNLIFQLDLALWLPHVLRVAALAYLLGIALDAGLPRLLQGLCGVGFAAGLWGWDLSFGALAVFPLIGALLPLAFALGKRLELRLCGPPPRPAHPPPPRRPGSLRLVVLGVLAGIGMMTFHLYADWTFVPLLLSTFFVLRAQLHSAITIMEAGEAPVSSGSASPEDRPAA